MLRHYRHVERVCDESRTEGCTDCRLCARREARAYRAALNRRSAEGAVGIPRVHHPARRDRHELRPEAGAGKIPNTVPQPVPPQLFRRHCGRAIEVAGTRKSAQRRDSRRRCRCRSCTLVLPGSIHTVTGRQLEYRSSAVKSAIRGRAIEVAGAIEDQPGVGILPVRRRCRSCKAPSPSSLLRWATAQTPSRRQRCRHRRSCRRDCPNYQRSVWRRGSARRCHCQSCTPVLRGSIHCLKGWSTAQIPFRR